MKKFLILFSILILASCASSKLALVPVGKWSYTITGTPNGTYNGVLKVTFADGKYAAVLNSSEGEITMRDVVYDKKIAKLSANFDFQGSIIFFETTTLGETMTGNVSTGGMNFPFKGTKKN